MARNDDLDEFAIQDEDDQTIVLTEDEADTGASEIQSDEEVMLEDEGEFEDAPGAPAQYKASSNIYAALLVLSFVAYAIGLVVILKEMQGYTDPKQFLWGLLN